MFSRLRGNLSSFAARTFFNTTYARYGTMTQLKIDPERKTIDVELMLRGERDPIQIHLSDYSLCSTPNGGAFSAIDIRVSREWMNVLAEDLLKNRAIPVPASAMKWLKLAL
jgi:hypothetical protein